MNAPLTDEPEVLVVPTGSCNLASVSAGLRRAGARPVVAGDADAVADAPRVVLPGVGAFGPARRALAANGFDRALAARVTAGRPTLAICLGLQLLCEGSDEAPGVDGLGLVPGTVRGLDPSPRLPHMGWSRVTPPDAPGLIPEGWAYFAHSFALTNEPAGCRVAWSTHGVPFVAALERDGLLACQGHPELSGRWGRRLIARWLARDAAPSAEAVRW